MSSDRSKPSRFWRRMRSRKIPHALIIYAGGSWVVLQVTDIFINNLELPPWVFPTVVLVLVVGLPIVLTLAYVRGGDETAGAVDDERPGAAGQEAAVEASAPGGARRLWPSWGRPLVGAVVGVLALFLAGTAFGVFRGLVETGAAYAVENPRQSITVAPFGLTADRAGFDWLSEGAAHMLTINLEGWEELRVTDRRRLEALLEERTKAAGELDLETMLEAARADRVGTLVMGEALVLGDALEIVVRLYDVATGELLRAPFRVTGSDDDDLRAHFDDAASWILELSGAPHVSPDVRAATTTSLAAYREYLDGLTHLYRWELEDAEDRFSRALAFDSTFALAYHKLALAKSWQPGFDRDEVAELAEAAAAFGQGLPPMQQDHVLAFNAFMHDEFDAAREIYRRILDRDSTDAEAWYGLGDVAFHADGVRLDSAGALRPATDWNAALRAFLEAVEADPRFHLGYGHAFDIYSAVNRSRYNAYDVPEGRLREAVGAELVYFYPAWRDSVLWIRLPPESRGDSIRKYRDPAVAEELRQTAESIALRWAAAAPRLARPHIELRALYAQADDYEAAREEHERVMALTGDTSARSLAILADLAMGGHDLVGAYEAATQSLALARADNETPRRWLANVFMARGMADTALELGVRPARERDKAFIPAPDGRIGFGDAVPLFDRIEVLGSVQAPRPELAAAVDSLIALWSGDAYTAEETTQLAEARTYLVARALMALGPDAFDRWFALRGGPPGIWRTWRLLTHDSLAAAAARLADDVDRLVQPDRTPPPLTLYTLGVLAQQLGQDSLAAEIFVAMDSSTYGVGGGLDGDWALLSLSYLRRAQSFEALDDRDAAIREYRRFLDYWGDADADLQHFADQARQALYRLAAAEPR